MNSGLCLLACAGHGSLDRTLLIGGAVARQGGTVVLLTYTPGLALRRTFFGLEVVVRRDEEPALELLRIGALAASRGARTLLLDDEQLGDRHAAAVRMLGGHLDVARYGPPLCAGAAGELIIDPYGPEEAGACCGPRYMPLHPGLRPLRDGRGWTGGEVGRVTVACCAPAHGLDVTLAVLEALSVWRPPLQVTVLCDLDMPRHEHSRLDQAARCCRHDVTLRPLLSGPQLGEALLCDLALVDDPDRAVMAAYLGTPVLLLSSTPAAARCGEALAQGGLALHLFCRPPDQPGPVLLADLVWSVCADQDRRAALSAAGRRALDGYGADRIAAALFELGASKIGGV